MKLDKIRTAIGLLNSMIECGEEHTETSRKVVDEALKQILEAEEKLKDTQYIIK